MNNDSIQASSRRFRSAMDSVRRHEFISKQLGSSDYPDGAASDASLLLGIYLLNEHGIDCDYVAAADLHGRGHAWLEHQGLVIDVTADLTSGGRDKVVVGPGHEGLLPYREAGRSRISEYDLSDLADDYDTVVSSII